MSTDSGQKFRDVFVASFAPDMNATATALVDAYLNQEIRYNVSQPLDASINTASTHTLDQSTAIQFRAKTFKVVVGTTISAANTNVATMALVYNNGAGGSDTTIASINTATTAGGGSGDITAGTAYAFTLNTSNVVIPAGSQVQVKVTKSGAGGLALPFLSFELKGVPA